jgi:cold shock CspA family protein
MRTIQAHLGAALLTLLAGAGCATVTGPDPGPPRLEGEIVGEVTRVDVLADQLVLRDRSGAVLRLHYQADTPVLYEGRQYTAENLEPGDLVRVEVHEDAQGALHARRIEVEQSAQDRPGRPAVPAPAGEEIEGEVLRVERDALVVDAEGAGTTRVHAAPGTVVTYRGERYEVSNLEPGDEVRVAVEDDGRGGLTTDSILVTRSRQERAGGEVPGDDDGDDVEAYVEAYTGRVTWVEADRGRFGLDADGVGPLAVHMPYNPAPADRRAFERLRSGDRVSLRGEPLGDGRVEVVRFE